MEKERENLARMQTEGDLNLSPNRRAWRESAIGAETDSTWDSPRARRAMLREPRCRGHRNRPARRTNASGEYAARAIGRRACGTGTPPGSSACLHRPGRRRPPRSLRQDDPVIAVLQASAIAARTTGSCPAPSNRSRPPPTLEGSPRVPSPVPRWDTRARFRAASGPPPARSDGGFETFEPADRAPRQETAILDSTWIRSGSFKRCCPVSYSIIRTPEWRRSEISTKQAPPMKRSRVMTDLSGVATII